MTTSEQHATATAYWTVGPEQGELRSEDLPAPGPGEALVRTLYSGISKGTELVVHRASVPECVANAETSKRDGSRRLRTDRGSLGTTQVWRPAATCSTGRP